MANSPAKERNKAVKGKTGFLTKRKRRQRGMKARPWGKGATPPGHPSSPTDHAPGIKKKAKKNG